MEWFEKEYSSKIIKEKIKVLDVGSYDVNGSYKDVFKNSRYEYIGLDIEKGPNVDIVLENPYDWSQVGTDTFDIVISGQTFEHTEFFWITLAEMVRVLKKGGLLCIIVPNGFGEHRYPVDCYRFFTDGMIAMARYVSLEILHTHTNCAPDINYNYWYSRRYADSMLVARKTYDGVARYLDLKTYKCIPADQIKLRTGLISYDLVNKLSIEFLFIQGKFFYNKFLNKMARIYKRLKLLG